MDAIVPFYQPMVSLAYVRAFMRGEAESADINAIVEEIVAWDGNGRPGYRETCELAITQQKYGPVEQLVGKYINGVYFQKDFQDAVGTVGIIPAKPQEKAAPEPES